jgi:hypothetical protein
VLAAQQPDEPRGAAGAAFAQWLADRGQVQVDGGLDVVEADDRQAARYRDARRVGRGHHAERLGVAVGEDRRRRVGQPEQLARQFRGGRGRVRAGADQRVAGRDARGRQRPAVAGDPVCRRTEPELADRWIADESDPAVAEAEQVPGGHLAAAHVVHDGARQPGRRGVDEHHGHAGVGQRGQLRGGQPQREHDDPGRPVPLGQPQRVVVTLRGRLGVEHDRVVAVGVEHLDDAGQPRHHRGPGEEGDEDGDTARRAPGEARGQPARAVAGPLDRVEYPPPGGGPHLRAAVQHPGDGAHADPGGGCHVGNSHPLRCSPFRPGCPCRTVQRACQGFRGGIPGRGGVLQWKRFQLWRF